MCVRVRERVTLSSGCRLLDNLFQLVTNWPCHAGSDTPHGLCGVSNAQRVL